MIDSNARHLFPPITELQPNHEIQHGAELEFCNGIKVTLLSIDSGAGPDRTSWHVEYANGARAVWDEVNTSELGAGMLSFRVRETLQQIGYMMYKRDLLTTGNKD